MNLKKKIINLEKQVREMTSEKQVIIAAHSREEFEERRDVYLETHPKTGRFIFIHIIYDE